MDTPDIYAQPSPPKHVLINDAQEQLTTPLAAGQDLVQHVQHWMRRPLVVELDGQRLVPFIHAQPKALALSHLLVQGFVQPLALGLSFRRRFSQEAVDPLALTMCLVQHPECRPHIHVQLRLFLLHQGGQVGLEQDVAGNPL